MAYRDKEAQREANRQAAKRRRDKAKGMTPNVIPVIPESHTPSYPNVIPSQAQPVIPASYPNVAVCTPAEWRYLVARVTDLEAINADLQARLTVLEARQPAYAPEPRIIAAPYRPVRGSGYQEQSYEDRNAMAGQMVRHTQTGKMVRVPMLDADGQPIPD